MIKQQGTSVKIFSVLMAVFLTAVFTGCNNPKQTGGGNPKIDKLKLPAAKVFFVRS